MTEQQPKPTRILVVDTSALTREILSRILRDELNDTEVEGAASGQEALEKLATQKFDLVTTALLLSDMDGLALSHSIRDSKSHHYTPVIIVSGDADSRLLREGFEAGVTDYFDKSNGYKAFGTFIKAFIQRNSGLSGHILFVEDSPTSAAVMCKMLEKHGLTYIHTKSADEAFKLLQAQRDNPNEVRHYDLLITDFYTIGNMTGGDLLHAIRAKFHFSQQELPVLVLTGADDHNTQLEVFHAGGNDFVAKPIVEEILLARVRALLLIKHQYDALKEQTEAMRWVAVTDSLTGVRSRRYLVDNGEAYLGATENQPVAAMIIDIDHFKNINDTLGHITGDHVLAALGKALNHVFPEDMVVRFGGEEFCVLARHCDTDTMLRRAEILRREIEQYKPADVNVTVSIGVTNTEAHPGLHISDFLMLADKGLYLAKETGRNRVCISDSQGQRLSPLHDNPLTP
ncbi:MAG: diguanylate cyclase [Proteobacteria bacterium]|jgi:two-component system, cell cycle response regulator|nr:diguanylate cyclase [Pseudomonadota bacterium]MCG6935270.1 diguanylate cyclase [Pseudomonadota bacterium]